MHEPFVICKTEVNSKQQSFTCILAPFRLAVSYASIIFTFHSHTATPCCIFFDAVQPSSDAAPEKKKIYSDVHWLSCLDGQITVEALLFCFLWQFVFSCLDVAQFHTKSLKVNEEIAKDIRPKKKIIIMKAKPKKILPVYPLPMRLVVLVINNNNNIVF